MNTNTFSPILANAVADVTETLRSFAADPLFAEKFNGVFGTVVSPEQFLQVVAVLPDIEVLADGELNSALGAFSAQTGKIYLSEALVVGNAAQLRSVLIEEIGHFVDAQVNTVDTAGDEGEYFAKVVLGQSLSEAEITRLKTEDDHAVRVVNEQSITVEQALTLVYSEEVVSDPSDWSSTAGGTEAVWVLNNYAYVGKAYSGVKIFDISNPFSPVLKSNYGS